jgi:hypothetical protein
VNMDCALLNFGRVRGTIALGGRGLCIIET